MGQGYSTSEQGVGEQPGPQGRELSAAAAAAAGPTSFSLDRSTLQQQQEEEQQQQEEARRLQQDEMLELITRKLPVRIPSGAALHWDSSPAWRTSSLPFAGWAREQEGSGPLLHCGSCAVAARDGLLTYEELDAAAVEVFCGSEPRSAWRQRGTLWGPRQPAGLVPHPSFTVYGQTVLVQELLLLRALAAGGEHDFSYDEVGAWTQGRTAPQAAAGNLHADRQAVDLAAPSQKCWHALARRSGAARRCITSWSWCWAACSSGAAAEATLACR